MFPTFLVGIQLFWKTAVSYEVNIHLSYDPAIPLLDIDTS